MKKPPLVFSNAPRPSPPPCDKGSRDKAAKCGQCEASLRAPGVPNSVVIELQGYREADSLVLGLGKDARLRYKVKMLKGVDHQP